MDQFKGPYSRSPDLTPLDYFLWGYVKHVEYASFNNPVISNEDLRILIRRACQGINPASVFPATNETWIMSAEACIRENGNQFEQYL